MNNDLSGTDGLALDKLELGSEDIESMGTDVWQRPEYQASDYLLFGGSSGYVLDSLLDIKGTLAYLDERGFSRSALASTRHASLEHHGQRDFFGGIERYCDFCGRPLTGVTFERLGDGRDRCAWCSESQVVGQQAYERVFRQVKSDLLMQFGVTLPDDIDVRIVSAERIAKQEKRTWKPTDGYDYRTTGIVKRSRWNRHTSIWLENGSPRVTLMMDIVQCLTGVWQFEAWDEVRLRKYYASEFEEVEKGMSAWVGVQYLYLLNEGAQAQRMREYLASLDTPTGKGFLRYVARYPLSEGVVLEGDTPFRHPDDPLRSME